MRRTMNDRGEGSLGRGLAVQARIIHALIIRDMVRRYGRANIGFLWIVLEPMLLTAGVMLIWGTIKSRYEHGVEVVAIVFTGYMPLTLFRHLTYQGVKIYRSSITYLYHRHITFIDVIIARAALEFAGMSTALIVVYAVLGVTELVRPIQDPGLLVLAWVVHALLSFGLMTVFAILTEYSEVTERLIQPFQYLLIPLSGCFFMVDWLPKSAQDAAWYNPTVHTYEMFRAGFFGESIVSYYTVWYPLLWSAILIAVGFGLIDAVRDKIHTG